MQFVKIPGGQATFTPQSYIIGAIKPPTVLSVLKSHKKSLHSLLGSCVKRQR